MHRRGSGNLGSRSGFVTKIKQKSPSAVGTHCVIHREALAARTPPVELMNSPNSVIKIVNFIKAGAMTTRLFTKLCHDVEADHEVLLFHINVRWLAKENMLERFYELKDEVKLFLEDQKKFDLLATINSEEFEISLAYLVEIFESLNKLNRQLQGRNNNIICHYDVIRAFIARLHLWKRRISDGNTGSFPHLDEALKEKPLNDDVKELIQTHLKTLRDEFCRYSPNIEEEILERKLIRNPFLTDVEDVPEFIQEEFLDMKSNSSAKDDFNSLTLENFWVRYSPIYQNASGLALRVIGRFSSTYLCEAGFSTLVFIKNKYRNRMGF